MKRSNRLVLLIGIFLALVAFVLIVLMFNNGGTEVGRASAAPTTVKVVVAARDIDLGATIVAEDLAPKDFPVDSKPADSFSDPSLVIGQVARAKVTSGQLITSAVLNNAGTINNIVIPAGFVGISVQVDQTTGVGTIIKPGDFVDVISGFTSTEKVPLVSTMTAGDPPCDLDELFCKVQDDRYNHTTVKTLAQGLQVLGTLLPPPTEAQAAESTAPDGSTTSLNGQQQIVILAVPTQDAEVIKFSQMDGSISLVLRSSADCTTKPADGVTYCPSVKTTGITLRRLIDDRGVLPPTVVQVIQPTPLPGTVPTPKPSPKASTKP